MAIATFQENRLYAAIGHGVTENPCRDAVYLTAKVYKAVKRTPHYLWLKDICGHVYKCEIKDPTNSGFEYVRAPKSGDIKNERKLAVWASEEIDPSDNRPGRIVNTAFGRAVVDYYEEI